jgi:signal peptidase I
LGLSAIRRRLYVKTLIPLVLLVSLLLGFFFGLPFILNTPTPIRVVESGSMCVQYDGACDGWLSLTHPFAPTLHKGDIIIVQGVDPKDLNTNYPNSDIIVYKKPTTPTDTPVVHRIVTSYEANHILYFQTKGDGNGTPWPAPVNSNEYDSNSGIILTGGEGVPADLVEGRVVMRIPYFGWLTLILRGTSWVLPVIIGFILLLLMLEFVLPQIRRKPKPAAEPNLKIEDNQKEIN